MVSRKPQVIAPREYFLELHDLFRALASQKQDLTPQSLEALARVLSWLPHSEDACIKTLSKETA